MGPREHSITQEGTAAGVFGAVLVAAWYLGFDVASGHPLRTPNVLGELVFRRDFAPGVRQIVPEVLAGVTMVHVLVFVLVGMALTFLIHLASGHPSWRMGVWIGLVVALGLFGGITLMFTTLSRQFLPVWSVLGGMVVGFTGMARYLWQRHPRLEQSFRDAPLGSEEGPPAHPSPGRGEP